MPEVVHNQTSYRLKVLASAEQIQKRVRELARQISADFRGQLIYTVGVLEDGFIFMSDLVRTLEGQVVCQFLKTYVTQHAREGGPTLEIFFRPELEVTNQHVLLVQGVVQTGITTDFLIRHLTTRGAASVRVAALVDRGSDRRVLLRADYFGFLLDDSYVVGYGLGTADFGRNLPYLAALEGQAAPTPSL
jgi:hypoxanthine phosphoribosyltransferase